MNARRTAQNEEALGGRFLQEGQGERIARCFRPLRRRASSARRKQAQAHQRERGGLGNLVNCSRPCPMMQPATQATRRC